MTTATKNLAHDHFQILRLIEVMEQIAKSDDPDVEHLELIVDVIREFADGLHHAKEEQILFPLMVKKGYSVEKGPVSVMLYEHQLGRNFVKGMADGISLLRLGDNIAIKDVSSHMTGYAGLLRNHIAKENNVLFPMADKAFNSAEQESLLLAFTKVENKQENGKSKDELVALIDTLAGIYRT